MLLLVLLSAVVMSAVELPGLVSNRRWKELVVFSAFVLAVVILGIILVLRITAPNPVKFIEAMYKPFTDAFFGKE
jgi:hypothetical protein